MKQAKASAQAWAFILRYRPGWAGLPIYEGNQVFEISVRQVDINNSNSWDPKSCPVALACEREHLEAIVFVTMSYIRVGDAIFHYQHSKPLITEIKRIDGSTEKFTPSAYLFLPPAERQRLGVTHPKTGEGAKITGQRRPARSFAYRQRPQKRTKALSRTRAPS